MATRPNDRIEYTLHHPAGHAQFDGPLLDGLLYAAEHLPSTERLELIEQLQAKHAEIDARFR